MADELEQLRKQIRLLEASNTGLRLHLRKVKALSTRRLEQRNEARRKHVLAKVRIEVLESALAHIKGE